MYGILCNPDPSSRNGAWFLHTCFRDSETFQYNPNPATWRTFNTMEEANAWFITWYKQRQDAKRWMPPKANFKVIEIPVNPVNKTVTGGEIINQPVNSDFKTIC